MKNMVLYTSVMVVLVMLGSSASGVSGVNTARVKASEPSKYVYGTYLLTTEWGQHGCYDDRCPFYIDPSEDPTSGSCRLGCWSVAIAQILRYYELQSSGVVDYTCSLDFIPPLPMIYPSHIHNHVGSHEYDWSLMPNSLTDSSPDAEKEMTNQFTFDVACVVKKDFGTGHYVNSGENFENLRDEIKDHFPDVKAATWDDDLAISIIQVSIDNFRPIMLYIRSTGDRFGNKTYHAVVLDGYRWNLSTADFEVHLNYGWGGVNNNWYDYSGPFPDYDDTSFRQALLITADLPTQLMQPVHTGLIHTTYTYQAKTIHRNLSAVYYQFDWGDGSVSEWMGRYEPGALCNASHEWNKSGVYAVCVRASDLGGWESNWSEPRLLYIPKYPRIVPLVARVFQVTERFPHLEPLLLPLIERLC